MFCSHPLSSQMFIWAWKVTVIFLLISKKRKNLAKLDWGKHRERNYGNKSHRNQFIWHSGKIRETAKTERQHITYPNSQQGWSIIGITLTNTGKKLFKSHHASFLVTPPICWCLWLQKFPAHTGSVGSACSHGGLDDSVLQKSYRKLRAQELMRYCPPKPPETIAWKAWGFLGHEMEDT